MPLTALAEPLGIVVAMSMEARSLCPMPSRRAGRTLVALDGLAISGLGAQRAAAAAERLVAGGARRLVNIGVAGGLLAGLRPGDLIVPEAIVDADEPSTTLLPDAALRERIVGALRSSLPVRGGVLATTAQPVLSSQAKQALWRRLLAAAVDLEAAAIARVAARLGVPFAAIKSICDPVERSVPSLTLGLVHASGRISVRAMLSVLARGPSAWRALAAPARDYAAARTSLAAVAPLLLAAIGEP
ncbi:MAG TPA: hypothetical protein VL742_15430 [Casimicrobiaceae bacterium]|nr:hypothetical protein [Casimicrobiaceae bacterium]